MTFPFGSPKAIPTDLVNEPTSYVVEAHQHMRPVRKFYVLFWQRTYGSAQYRIVNAETGVFQTEVWLSPGAYSMSDIADKVLLSVYGHFFKDGLVTGSCKMLGVVS